MNTNLEIFHHTAKVQTVGLFVKVSVVSDFQSRVFEDGGVVAPTGWGEVDFGFATIFGFVPSTQKCATNAKSTSTGNGLRSGDLMEQVYQYKRKSDNFEEKWRTKLPWTARESFP